MTVDRPQSDLASPHEVQMALARLSTADLLRIKQLAKLRAAGLTTVDWQDLLNEAISRILAGTRRWPRSVPLVAFLAQTMRSVASEEWRRINQDREILESDLAPTKQGSPVALAEIAVDPVDPERETMARRTIGEIQRLFRDDHEAIEVLHGMARGLAPDEIQSEAGMSETQYASAQKRIRRCLARHFL